MNIERKQIEFMKLYEPCREGLVRFSKAITRGREDAMDLVQDTTLKAFDNFEKLKNPIAFKSYLFSIASRLHKRQTWRKRIFSVFGSNEEADCLFDNLPSKESSTDVTYDIQVLYRSLDLLSDKHKEAIILYEISGLSMQEICDIQGGSVSTVKSRVQRARKELEKILGVNTNIPKTKTETKSDNSYYSKKNGIAREFIYKKSSFIPGVNYEK